MAKIGTKLSITDPVDRAPYPRPVSFRLLHIAARRRLRRRGSFQGNSRLLSELPGAHGPDFLGLRGTTIPANGVARYGSRQVISDAKTIIRIPRSDFANHDIGLVAAAAREPIRPDMSPRQGLQTEGDP